MRKWVQAGILALGLTITSCQGVVDSNDNPVELEVTLEDALKDGTIVVLSFNLDGVDYDVAFVRVGDTYELLEDVITRGDGNDSSSETVQLEKAFDFLMEYDKNSGLLKFFVKEKETSDLVLTAIFDIKQSTIEVIPGNSKIKVTGLKMKVSNVEITSQLKEKTEEVTLTDALVKGAKVEVAYKWNGSSLTVFTFVNEGGTFSCNISGADAKNFEGSSLKVNGSTLEFSGENWSDYDCTLKIHFNTADNTYRFWTVNHEYYTSYTISVNGTNITSKLTEKR